MENILIRREARRWGVPLWAVARKLGISEATLTRKLRQELQGEERQRFLDAINELANEMEGRNG